MIEIKGLNRRDKLSLMINTTPTVVHPIYYGNGGYNHGNRSVNDYKPTTYMSNSFNYGGGKNLPVVHNPQSKVPSKSSKTICFYEWSDTYRLPIKFDSVDRFSEFCSFHGINFYGYQKDVINNLCSELVFVACPHGEKTILIKTSWHELNDELRKRSGKMTIHVN